MRLFLFPIALLAGCAGHVADYVGPRTDIIAEQLPRYGLNLLQSRCIGERLGGSLSPRQLRLLSRSAASVQQGYYEPERLTIRDLLHVASSMSDATIGLAMVRAAASCDATPELIARREAPPADVAPTAPAPRPIAWLNLGAAPTGQRIAIDASSLEQDAATRLAWFRLQDPGATGPSAISYLLRIDCQARTISATARRVQDASGAVTEHRDFSADDAQPNPVENGTVMEIAFLSVCT